MSEGQDCDVIIIGGGPCGLMLSIELGRRGISTILLEERTVPSRFPSANATQARTMEHYRRLGFAEKVRAEGLPPDYPTDIAYFTRYTKHELARFSLPSARAAREMVKTLSGSWSAAELPHRVSQIFVEDVLRAEAAACPTVSLRPGWRMTAIRDNGTGVEVDAESNGQSATLRGAYTVAADGGGSPTRKMLGINYEGESGAVRDFMGGRMFAIHFRAPKLYDVLPHARAWMYWAINHHRRAFMAAVNGRDEFTFHTQIQPGIRASEISDAQAVAMFHEGFAAPLDIEIIGRSSWNAGFTLVADKFQRGRILLGGDAVHLFTPTGGLGYNTAVEDAVNLGWKLSAVLKGWGGAGLLETYEAERKAIAKRNTTYARGFADSVGLFALPLEVENDGPEGDAARKLTGDHYNHHARFEFNIPGITFGGRYDGSPIIVGDGTAPPPDSPNAYVPTGCPGGRAPHLWLDDGRSLYDALGFEFTLLVLNQNAAGAEKFRQAADGQNIPLTVVAVTADGARELYGADLALIRPDQIVAWRGNISADAAKVLRQATGHK
ncbi:FAD-dependent oxidoreductase [Rhodoplanes sp. Z2-YC6860]|uniref:FAD-dependent oxidoreductase n=1 Tax=Rhodoplanes sp. Z2-YC6860 TaxID=674703 RepID=UPI00078DA8C3|nr:FAD-dependent oxidoreductase [Rhodoplanes sp. Z2-YC6860]AMN38538.1 Monooxygenase, FAD-binding protein [Rhodoplanes sp. Z2-YC6860]